MDGEHGGRQSTGSQRVRYDWVTNTDVFKYIFKIVWCVYVYEKPKLSFPGDSVVKNLSANAGDMDMICDPGRSHMHMEQLSPYTTTIEPVL